MAVLEQWQLDGLALNDATFELEAIADDPPQKAGEWISGADSNGAILGRPPLLPNRVIEMTIRVAKQATMDLALAKVALVIDKLQECEQNVNGLALVWTPSDATIPSVTARCLMGQVKNFPKDWSGSNYFAKNPVFTIELTCLPFFEGTEYLEGSVTSSDPMQVLELAGVPGDAPAKGRLVVTDAGSKSRRWMAWGIESRWYPTSSPPSLIIDSTSMVTSGFAGTTITSPLGGAYSGATNNVISATLRTQNQAICGLGDLTHVGAFRTYLRFIASDTTMAVRLTYQTLDGPFRSLSYKVPVTDGFGMVELGLVELDKAVLGSQRWTGRIEAYSTATGGEIIYIDVMYMVPAEQFGRARAPYSYTAGVIAGYDDFTAITAGTALNARVSPVGGTWATSGATTDFTASDAPTGEETMQRSTTADAASTPRYAVLGSTNYTNVEVGVRFRWTANVGTALGGSRLYARWTDSANHIVMYAYYSGSQWRLYFQVIVAGAESVFRSTGCNQPLNTDTWYQYRIVAYVSGAVWGTLMDASGAVIAEVTAQTTIAATGGTLATGKPAFADYNPGAVASTRYYDSFYVATPAPEPIVCHSGQSIEFRHDSTLREDSTGTYAGPPPEYVGGRFYVEPAGGAGRKSRVGVIARRTDVETGYDESIADPTTLQVYITPSYVLVPRA